ncbi:Nodule Cysteine-Rich (NCR) secreted peptide [Medicago truncatula]|uniref:Nodule Cysteine-Rich (NCR) secreted peptide n=2 Tax=Medicago truncatula TaxID=3880 RepID=G7K1M3_MEDTR|nr:Nodule Cysteine-Rich (NCR) secreted peptide [Medicago truncatula]AFK38132.1 unknown [Medicago truncatula]
MSQILTFVYAMILFISIFLVAAEVDWIYHLCDTDTDCPEHWSKFFIYKCVNHVCDSISKVTTDSKEYKNFP